MSVFLMISMQRMLTSLNVVGNHVHDICLKT